MAKKTKKRPASSSGLTRLTKQKVTDGLPGPDGVRIRYAVPEEAGAVTELMRMADDDMETGHLEALAAGQCGTWLLNALAGADPAEPLVRALSAGSLQPAAAALSLPLVAHDRDGQVVGALLAVPSGWITSRIAHLPGARQHALLSMLKYAKVKGLAVREDARGRGIGAALLKRCVQVYWQLDYVLLFGEFATERNLGPYYTRQGFTVLGPGQAIDVGTLLTGEPLHLSAGPGETLFYRWRGNLH